MTKIQVLGLNRNTIVTCLSQLMGFQSSIWYALYYFGSIGLLLTRLTGRVSLVEQELLTLPEYLSSTSVLLGFVLLDL